MKKRILFVVLGGILAFIGYRYYKQRKAAMILGNKNTPDVSDENSTNFGQPVIPDFQTGLVLPINPTNYEKAEILLNEYIGIRTKMINNEYPLSQDYNSANNQLNELIGQIMQLGYVINNYKLQPV
jgi:hypothetical protein